MRSSGLELETYTSSKFYLNSTDGTMVFITDVDGATTSASASYPRTELREMQQWPIHDGFHNMSGARGAPTAGGEGECDCRTD